MFSEYVANADYIIPSLLSPRGWQKYYEVYIVMCDASVPKETLCNSSFLFLTTNIATVCYY